MGGKLDFCRSILSSFHATMIKKKIIFFLSIEISTVLYEFNGVGNGISKWREVSDFSPFQCSFIFSVIHNLKYELLQAIQINI